MSSRAWITFGATLFVCACASSRSSSYRLPYPPGAEYKVIQGNGGRWGHSGAAEFAYDFVMPKGSPVAAARGGVVVKTESRFADDTRKPGEENYVFVRHGDGTFGRYYHLTTGGALVSAGQRVRAGDIIGRSGNSGASAGAHLHFDVTRECPEWGCQTVFARFTDVPENPLREGATYRAH